MSPPSKRSLSLTAAVTCLLACADPGTPPLGCVTGMQVHCGCVGGAVGAQTCVGGAYQPCVCPPLPDASVDAAPDVPADVIADVMADAAPEASLDAMADVTVEASVDVAPDAPTDGGGDVDASGDLGPSLAAPRPLAPGSAGVVGTARPTFRWSPPPGATGARIELCRDRALTAGCVTLDAVGARVAPAAGLAEGAWFWRVRAVAGAAAGAAGPTWTFSVTARRASSDVTRGTTVDVNGDGYADVVIGTRHASAVFVYHGGPSGLGAAPSTVLAYPPGEVRDLWNAGDVDGDGYTDLLVDSGARLRLHRGGAAGVGAAPTEVPLPAGRQIESAVGVGDVNGDGFADAYVVHGDPAVTAGRTASLYLGGAAGLTQAGGVTGEGFFFDHQLQVSAAGDANADGYADVAIWSPVNGNEVRVYHGGPAGPAAASLTLTYERPTPRVTGPGDLNGDGFADLIVTPNYTTMAVTYHGGPSGIAPAVVSTIAGGPIYQSASAGDVNGDGYADALFGEGFPPSERAVYLRYGGAEGLSRTAVTTTRGAGFYGVALGGPGDVNGDGFADVVIGSGGTSYRGNEGRAYVHQGAAGGLATAPTRTLEDPTTPGYGASLLAVTDGYAAGASAGPIAICDITGQRRRYLPGTLLGGYGAAIADAGDTNRTGGAEFAVGAPGVSTVFVPLDGIRTVALTGPAGSALGAALAGPVDVDGDRFADVVAGAPSAARVLVFHGSTFGPSSSSPTTLTGPAGSRFGAAIGLAGDVDRDGSPELVVGAPGADQVSLYRTGPGGLGATPASVLRGPAGSEFGAAVLGAGDLDQDGYADVAVGAPGAGRVYVYRGGPGGLLAAPWAVLVGAAGGRFGGAIAVALNARTASPDDRALVVGAPSAARASLYEITRAGVVATPFLDLTGPAGSAFGASLLHVRFLGLIVGAPGAHTVYEFPHTHDARGALLPLGPAGTATTAPPSDFGCVTAGRIGG